MTGIGIGIITESQMSGMKMNRAGKAYAKCAHALHIGDARDNQKWAKTTKNWGKLQCFTLPRHQITVL